MEAERFTLDMGAQTTSVGSGIHWPLEFTESGKVRDIPVDDPELRKINQAIQMCLLTARGERFGNILYGSDLPLLVHDPFDDVLRDRIVVAVSESLAAHEPRIELLDVTFPDSETNEDPFDKTIRINIEYKLRNSNRRGNVNLSVEGTQ